MSKQRTSVRPQHSKLNAKLVSRKDWRDCFALSLFSGAGGMDLGVHEAGFNVLASLEIDPHCCETLRAWKKKKRLKTQIIENDITQVDPSELIKNLGLEPGQLDLLFGGPPCQAFSQIGAQKSLGDARGMLLFQMVRFAKVFRPKAVLIEQVKGLLGAKDMNDTKGGVFRELLANLRSIGYEPKFQVLNAAQYGVPQLRERVFIVSMPGSNNFIFPSPDYTEESKDSNLFQLNPYITVGDVLKGLSKPPIQNGKPLSLRIPNHVDVTPKGDRRRISGVPEGEWLSAQAHLPAEQRGGLTQKDSTKYRRLSRKKPSLTLRCGEIFFHPTQDRYLTPREYLRLHGYPNDYVLMGPVRSRSGRVRFLDQHRQVANSVPPPVALRLARNIKEALRCRKFSKSSVSH